MIDRMARRASASLRAATAARPLSEETNRSGARVSWSRLAFAGVTAVVLIIGLLVIAGRRTDPPAAPTGPDPRWLIGDLPTGWSLTSVRGPNGTPLSGDDQLRQITLFATDRSPVGPIVAVIWDDFLGRTGPGIDPTVGNYVELTLDGRRAALADGEAGQRFLYVEVDGRWVTIETRGVSDDDLEQIGIDLRFADGRLVVESSALPVGLVRLGGDAMLDLAPTRDGITEASYHTPQNIDRNLILTTAPAPSPSTAWLGLIGEMRQPVDIDGSTAYVIHGTDQHFGPTYAAIFWVRSGLAFTISGHGVADDDLIAAARSIRPATDDEWNAAMQPPVEDEPAATTPADDAASGTTGPPPTDPPRPTDDTGWGDTGSGNEPMIEDLPASVDVAIGTGGQLRFSGVTSGGITWSNEVRSSSTPSRSSPMCRWRRTPPGSPRET